MDDTVERNGVFSSDVMTLLARGTSAYIQSYAATVAYALEPWLKCRFVEKRGR